MPVSPRIIATAPGRCGLVGNPTDMYGGSVISCSTRERATSILHQNTDGIIISVSGQSQTITSVDDLALREDDYLNVARAVLQALEVDPNTTPPFHLESTTDIPIQAGLAGSTAILTTIVGCCLEHLDIRLNPYETAELIRKIEYDILGVVCGFQDHYMATFGGLNYMDFRDKYNDEIQDGASAFATVEPMTPFVDPVPLLLAHTGVKHHSGTVHKSIRDRWLDGEPAVVEGYLEIARLARGAKKALLACDWDALGDLMNRNHAIQRDLGGSGEANERLIKAARAAGAIGAKLAGAGGGGTIIALGTDLPKLAQALVDAGADKILYPEPVAGLTVELPG
jgi:galactokinase/mevalonate kinase-like predicted kinase